jgi:pimeloyl-ACP methyl ester carboxylesterase
VGTEVVAGASLAPGFQGKTFRAREISIHYAEGPRNGPPLVLLHGLARDWRSFLVLLPDLSSRFHVFALDLRGHGESSRATRGYRITQYAQDVSEFLKTMLPGGASIFGHSLGGEVGMYVAAERNCRVTALIAGDSLISPQNFARSMYDPIFLQLRELILRGGSQEELARGIGKIEIRVPDLDETVGIEELPGNSETVLLEWARGAMLTDPDALAMTLDGSSFEGWNPAEILSRISCPTLLLQGNPELDALLSDSDVTLALKLLTKAEHVKFPLLGHALFMQQPKPVLQAITDFMQRHAAGLGD